MRIAPIETPQLFLYISMCSLSLSREVCSHWKCHYCIILSIIFLTFVIPLIWRDIPYRNYISIIGNGDKAVAIKIDLHEASRACIEYVWANQVGMLNRLWRCMRILRPHALLTNQEKMGFSVRRILNTRGISHHRIRLYLHFCAIDLKKSFVIT